MYSTILTIPGWFSTYRPLQPKLQVIHPAGPAEAPQPVPENETSSVDLLLLFGRSEKNHSHVHLSTQRMHQFYVEITPNSHRILLDLMGIYTLASILDPNWPWHPKLSQKASLTSLKLPMQLFWSDSAICEVLALIISLKKVPKKGNSTWNLHKWCFYSTSAIASSFT